MVARNWEYVNSFSWQFNTYWFRGYQKPYKLALQRQLFNQPSLLSRISLSASVSSYSSFLSHVDVTCKDEWFGWHTFAFQKIRSMVYQECFPGVRMSQEDLHFISPIQFDSWLASPVDFPKVLVSFRVLTMIFPLWGFPRGLHASIYTFGS